MKQFDSGENYSASVFEKTNNTESLVLIFSNFKKYLKNFNISLLLIYEEYVQLRLKKLLAKTQIDYNELWLKHEFQNKKQVEVNFFLFFSFS